MHRFDELLRDCRLLFGRDTAISRQFLESLQMAALKSAFRRAALVTHPDLFSGRGRAIQKYHADLFIVASEAYKRLTLFLTQRSSRRSASASPHASAPARQAPRTRPSPSGTSRPRSGGHHDPNPRFAAEARPSPRGRIYVPHCAPAWPLRTGEFLYYSKVISWKLLISAIVWQRRQRERIGEIAQRWGWLSEREILEVAARKFLGERIGEVLLRYEWLTPFQLRTLLYYQRKSQRPIGHFFVEQGLLSERDLDKYLEDLEAHNRKCQDRIAEYPLNLGFAAGPFRGTRMN
jgi:hypothetical protein